METLIKKMPYANEYAVHSIMTEEELKKFQFFSSHMSIEQFKANEANLFSIAHLISKSIDIDLLIHHLKVMQGSGYKDVSLLIDFDLFSESENEQQLSDVMLAFS